MNLDELKIGQSAVVTKVGGEGALRRHLLDMGITPKTRITLRKKAPMGEDMNLRYVLETQKKLKLILKKRRRNNEA